MLNNYKIWGQSIDDNVKCFRLTCSKMYDCKRNLPRNPASKDQDNLQPKLTIPEMKIVQHYKTPVRKYKIKKNPEIPENTIKWMLKSINQMLKSQNETNPKTAIGFKAQQKDTKKQVKEKNVFLQRQNGMKINAELKESAQKKKDRLHKKKKINFMKDVFDAKGKTPQIKYWGKYFSDANLNKIYHLPKKNKGVNEKLSDVISINLLSNKSESEEVNKKNTIKDKSKRLRDVSLNKKNDTVIKDSDLSKKHLEKIHHTPRQKVGKNIKDKTKNFSDSNLKRVQHIPKKIKSDNVIKEGRKEVNKTSSHENLKRKKGQPIPKKRKNNKIAKDNKINNIQSKSSDTTRKNAVRKHSNIHNAVNRTKRKVWREMFSDEVLDKMVDFQQATVYIKRRLSNKNYKRYSRSSTCSKTDSRRTKLKEKRLKKDTLKLNESKINESIRLPEDMDRHSNISGSSESSLSGVSQSNSPYEKNEHISEDPAKEQRSELALSNSKTVHSEVNDSERVAYNIRFSITPDSKNVAEPQALCLYYPYDSIYQKEPKPPKKVTTKLKRKREVKQKEAKHQVDAPADQVACDCCICNRLNRYRSDGDAPFIVKMKKQLKLQELKAYLRNKQRLNPGDSKSKSKSNSNSNSKCSDKIVPCCQIGPSISSGNKGKLHSLCTASTDLDRVHEIGLFDK